GTVVRVRVPLPAFSFLGGLRRARGQSYHGQSDHGRSTTVSRAVTKYGRSTTRLPLGSSNVTRTRYRRAGMVARNVRLECHREAPRNSIALTSECSTCAWRAALGGIVAASCMVPFAFSLLTVCVGSAHRRTGTL